MMVFRANHQVSETAIDSVTAYAFDAYGTLFDVHAAMAAHRPAMGPDAAAFSALWRAKQLEYTWTRTLMGRYCDFWTLTGEALDFALAAYPAVPASLRQPLLDVYFALPAFADARAALERLSAAGARAVIFTNGTEPMAARAAASAGLTDLIEGIVSVDGLGRYKTVPETYALVHERLGCAPGAVALVSSNRWDIAGAAAAGMPGIWVNRSGAADEYADLAPVRTVRSLDDIGR